MWACYALATKGRDAAARGFAFTSRRMHVVPRTLAPCLATPMQLPVRHADHSGVRRVAAAKSGTRRQPPAHWRTNRHATSTAAVQQNKRARPSLATCVSLEKSMTSSLMSRSVLKPRATLLVTAACLARVHRPDPGVGAASVATATLSDIFEKRPIGVARNRAAAATPGG